MTRQEIEERMNELGRKYVETHDPEIPYELYKLARELEKYLPGPKRTSAIARNKREGRD